ncbi:hypothetical protein PORCRE_1291 [Porphyromonas crevioricanis JCM 15906]|uniref:Uncharacterized protein n=1 Tax=Porphyromonas crevioricanis JCM 15906 TaxID=1305617 RepID=T1CHW1_9PORP|nr:hypothetical protein PORCRE_1291 [Porphyromonas crevioricanis JCM 15906]
MSGYRSHNIYSDWGRKEYGGRCTRGEDRDVFANVIRHVFA